VPPDESPTDAGREDLSTLAAPRNMRSFAPASLRGFCIHRGLYFHSNQKALIQHSDVLANLRMLLKSPEGQIKIF